MNYMLMPYRRFADFNGRSRRSEFWMFVLLQVIVTFVFIFLLFAAGGAMMLTGGEPTQLLAAGGMMAIFAIGFVIYWLATIIPYYAVSVRRLHDTDRTGWWAFIPLLINLFAQVVALGTAATGDFGAMVVAAGAISMIGFVISIVVLVFLCLDGTPGPNRFGHDPKQRGYEHTFA
jgi:uncharacterized membrane protein YhaH (DUF805 family)